MLNSNKTYTYTLKTCSLHKNLYNLLASRASGLSEFTGPPNFTIQVFFSPTIGMLTVIKFAERMQPLFLLLVKYLHILRTFIHL